MDIVRALDHTFAHTRTVVAGVRPEQYGEPTPCVEWDVRTLLEHVIGVVANMAAAVSGQAPDPDFRLGANPAAQFDSAATAALAGWSAPGVLDSTLDGGAGPMPGRVLASINLLDTAAHTWDLAKATGQTVTLPEDVARAAHEAALQIAVGDTRKGRFGPEQDAPDDADPTERLVAFLGRRPR